MTVSMGMDGQLKYVSVVFRVFLHAGDKLKSSKMATWFLIFLGIALCSFIFGTRGPCRFIFFLSQILILILVIFLFIKEQLNIVACSRCYLHQDLQIRDRE